MLLIKMSANVVGWRRKKNRASNERAGIAETLDPPTFAGDVIRADFVGVRVEKEAQCDVSNDADCVRAELPCLTPSRLTGVSLRPEGSRHGIYPLG